jgi:chromatin remodeling complex protein RSC6
MILKHKRKQMAPRKSTKKETPASVETPVVVETVAEPVADVVVSETPAPVESEVEVDKFVVVLELLQRWATDIKNATSLVKTLQKEHQKAQKASVKKPKKTASSSAEGKTRTPSGFAKPTKLSDELCAFLGVPAGSQLARTEVTRVLNEYIKKNNLQDANDKRTIVPDEKLSSILKLQGDDKLTYFNLQTYIKHHFQKDVPVV